MPEVFQGLGVFEWTILMLASCCSAIASTCGRPADLAAVHGVPTTGDFVIAAVLAVLGIGSYVAGACSRATS